MTLVSKAVFITYDTCFWSRVHAQSAVLLNVNAVREEWLQDILLTSESFQT